MIQKKEDQITKLNELKTILMSEAVLGITDITKIQVPEFEYYDEVEDESEDDEVDEKPTDEEV